ncbi:MAG: hypothetical protein ACRDHG_11905, partial [Anaerolineales bacterium]
MNATPLVLKNPKGWFAAGAEIETALTLLSDGAFKLFVYLCLQARRDTGVLETTQTELARGLHKGAASLRSYLREMETAGVCRSHFSRSPASRGRIEVTEAFWPYRKPESEKPDPAAEAFVVALKKLLQARPCIQTVFSTADEILARSWFQQGISLDRMEHVILLGCVRKYASWRNHSRQGPIRSLRYFQSVLDELDQPDVGPDYWNYLRLRLDRMEKLWNQDRAPTAPSEPGTATQPPPSHSPT